MPEKLLDSFHTGLVTGEEVEARPYGFRVTWIKWDSGFRGTDLQIGDRIIGIDGMLYGVRERAAADQAPGGYAEDQYWATHGSRDGRPVKLTVWRDGETAEIVGALRADRYYTTSDGRRALSPQGPDAMKNDGFDNSWAAWLEKFENRVSNILDGGWQRHLNIRVELADALDEAARIEFLLKNYPGPFATTTKADFDRLIESLKGRKYELTPEDLAYRSLTTHRVQDVVAAAKAARVAFLGSSKAVPLDSIPPTDAIRDDRRSIAGKCVILPPVSDLISEAGHGWFCVGGQGITLVLVGLESAQMTAVLRAVYRYQQLVEPGIDETHEMIVRLTDTPKMVATPRAAYVGILGEVIADTVGGKVFVDLTTDEAEPRFANEANIHKMPKVEIRSSSSPEEVMNAFIAALKLGDQDLWASFFASWTCGKDDFDKYIYDPEGGPEPNSLNMEYVHARKMIMSEVYDVRVAKVGRTRILLDKPKIEAVTIELDHVGLFDGEYRAYRDAELERIWRLQRVDGGPWRITSIQSI